ncbi:protein kinase, ATP binding site-containing protein [Tanacetum coccineum]
MSSLYENFLAMQEAALFASSGYSMIPENSRHIRIGQLYKLWKNRTAAIASGNYLEEADRIIPVLYHENIIPFYSEDVYSRNAIIGTLNNYLQEEKRCNFTWAQRLKACLGVAKGLSYLHSGVGDHGRGHRRCFKEQKMINMVLRFHDGGSEQLIDPYITDDVDRRSFHRFIEIAYKCISLNIEDRPKMDKIVKTIEEAFG